MDRSPYDPGAADAAPLAITADARSKCPSLSVRPSRSLSLSMYARTCRRHTHTLTRCLFISLAVDGCGQRRQSVAVIRVSLALSTAVVLLI